MGELKYHVRELRIHPEKLTKWHQEQEQEAAKANALNKETQKQEKIDNATHEWLNYKNKLGAAITQIYPRRNKQTHAGEPEWVTKLAQWRHEKEIRQLDHA